MRLYNNKDFCYRYKRMDESFAYGDTKIFQCWESRRYGRGVIAKIVQCATDQYIVYFMVAGKTWNMVDEPTSMEMVRDALCSWIYDGMMIELELGKCSMDKIRQLYQEDTMILENPMTLYREVIEASKLNRQFDQITGKIGEVLFTGKTEGAGVPGKIVKVWRRKHDDDFPLLNIQLADGTVHTSVPHYTMVTGAVCFYYRIVQAS